MSTRDASSKQEKRIAKDLGGNVVVGSGSSDFKKGDVWLDKFLLEAKTLMKPQKSHKVMKEWYEKAKEQAFNMRKDDYIVAFDFGDGQDIYSTHKQLFTDMLGCYEAIQEIIELIGYDTKFNELEEMAKIKEIIRRNF